MLGFVLRALRAKKYLVQSAFALVLSTCPSWASVTKVVTVPGVPVLPLLAGEGPAFGPDVSADGYVTQEFFLSGAATAYRTDGDISADGRWSVTPAEAAPYVTRLFVVRPSDPKKFNGTVVVEWINVTAGTDVACEWGAIHRELVRKGYAYVGVSAQKIGIEGGQGAYSPANTPNRGLRSLDPKRYAMLTHPGDSFSYDIYSQAGRAIRANAGRLLGPLVPQRVLAAGESQSAARLSTYINAVDPVAKVYDGFLVHSRFGAVPPLRGEGMMTDGSVPFRPDLRVPVIATESESDVFWASRPGYFGARVPDSSKLRVWEIAGAAHADVYTFRVGGMDSGRVSTEQLAYAWQVPEIGFPMPGLQFPINSGAQFHYVTQAALAALDTWVRTGTAPASASQLGTTATPGSSAPAPEVDANGLITGGVRSPWVDAPTAIISGLGNAGAPAAWAVGVTKPFGAAKLKQLYPGGKAQYLADFVKSLDAAISSGFLLADDRQEILDLAARSYPTEN